MPTTDCGFQDQQILVRFGPTISIQVGFDAGFAPGRNGAPALPADRFPALIDTGAEECCIDNDLATALNLPIVDRREVAGAHGSAEVNVYLGQVHVPSLQFTMYGMFAGVTLRAGGQPHFALIGRTFLRHFSMHYDGHSGAVILSNDR
jgi:predicted aspartyl protease